MVAEDATITEEVQAADLEAEEARPHVVKETSHQGVKADSEATVTSVLQEKAVSKLQLHDVKGFHHQNREALKERQDVQKALVMHQNQNVRGKAKRFC